MPPAFAAATALPRAAPAAPATCRRALVVAKKKGRGKKPAKSQRARQPPVPQTPGPAPGQDASPPTPPTASLLPTFPGPVAPELLAGGADLGAGDVNLIDTMDTMASVGPLDALDDLETASFEAQEGTARLPMENEARLKLPEMGVAPKGVKRKRKPRAAVRKASGSGVMEDDDNAAPFGSTRETLPSERVRELTAAYRRGGVDAEVLIDQIEKDPDYMLQTGNPEGEYDLTSAIIGTGRPNKQGIYLLPYLQSGHVLLLTIVLLGTFVYYPGFPLTELDDAMREMLKRGLAITYICNSILATFAYREAQKRKQPASFWAFKTAFLGNLAFSELKGNAPLEEK